jgi:acetoin utilization deacetylase AcuC-like enzyme
MEKSMSATIVFRDERCIDHVTPAGHPECPQRLISIYGMLDAQASGAGYEFRTPREATPEELALNHALSYIDAIKATAGRQSVRLDPDTSTSAGSWTAARLAAGAVLDGCDMLMSGRAANAMALVRPPGHHAEHDRAMGFCLFNNVAVGARYLLKNHGLERVMIFDWDIHHGNGTQNAFYSMPEVLYVSAHQYPYYPGTGALHETGSGAGTGYTVNIPLAGGQGDADYLLLLEQVLVPLARAYKPQLIIVSAGYDTYVNDPLGTMDVTPIGFGTMTSRLKQLAEELCQGRLLLALEGGYHLDGIAQSIQHTLNALAGHNAQLYDGNTGVQPASQASVGRVIAEVRKVHAQTWPVFKA